jgi:hypothetical protein
MRVRDARVSVLLFWRIPYYVKRRLQPPAEAGSSLADFYTLQMEMMRSPETSVYTISIGRQIPEDGLLNCYIKTWRLEVVDEKAEGSESNNSEQAFQDFNFLLISSIIQNCITVVSKYFNFSKFLNIY